MALHLPFGQNASLGQRFYVAPQADGGVLAIDGTGSITYAGPSLDATALETFTGTGSETFSGPALASTGTETFTSTGAVAFSGPLLDGTGTAAAPGVTGTGAGTITGPALAATGAESFTALGAVALAGPSLSGSGSETFQSDGAVVFATAVVGAGAETFTGTSVMAFAGPALDGGVPLDITGTGAVAFQAPGVTGLATGGDESQLGGGRRYVYPVHQPAQEVIDGAGVFALQAAQLAGVGALAVAGTGATALVKAALTGDGGQTIGGVGTVVAPIVLRGAGSVLTRRLVSLKALSPARSISGVGTLTAGCVPGVADGSVSHPAPDAIDRAWTDLQADDELLLLLGVIT